MASLGQVNYYCDMNGCKSKNRLIKTLEEIVNEHGDHANKLKTLDQLREDLLKEDHPLKAISQLSGQDESTKLNQFIDDGIQKLIKDFTIVANDMKKIFIK